MKKQTIDLWVGLFVLAGIAALLFLALKVGNLAGTQIKNPYIVVAEFDNIGGLKPRAAVRSSGVLVGRVSAIRYDQESFRARVEIAVDGQYAFPRDTIASIYTSGLLGEQYIGFEPGGDPKNLANGDAIRITQSAVVLEKLISQFLFSKAEDPGTKAADNTNNASAQPADPASAN